MLVKCNVALNIREKRPLKPYKSITYIALNFMQYSLRFDCFYNAHLHTVRTNRHTDSSMYTHAVHVDMISLSDTNTHTDTHRHTHTVIRKLSSVFLLASDFFPWVKDNTIPFFLISLQYIFQFCLLHAWNSFSNGNICFVNQICIMHRMQSAN